MEKEVGRVVVTVLRRPHQVILSHEPGVVVQTLIPVLERQKQGSLDYIVISRTARPMRRPYL